MSFYQTQAYGTHDPTKDVSLPSLSMKIFMYVLWMEYCSMQTFSDVRVTMLVNNCYLELFYSAIAGCHNQHAK